MQLSCRRRWTYFTDTSAFCTRTIANFRDAQFLRFASTHFWISTRDLFFDTTILFHAQREVGVKTGNFNGSQSRWLPGTRKKGPFARDGEERVDSCGRDLSPASSNNNFTEIAQFYVHSGTRLHTHTHTHIHVNTYARNQTHLYARFSRGENSVNRKSPPAEKTRGDGTCTRRFTTARVPWTRLIE